jgi:actin-like ATPase involved in cell morphogenesis
MPFALINTVHIENVDLTREALYSEVIDGVKQAPGFIHGTWTADRATGRGIGFVVFEHRDQAESLMYIQQSAAMELPPGVTLESATVYEVQGEA